MKKYERAAIHALYAVLAIATLFITTPAGASFVLHHPALAGFVPIFVGLARALEAYKRGK